MSEAKVEFVFPDDNFKKLGARPIAVFFITPEGSIYARLVGGLSSETIEAVMETFQLERLECGEQSHKS